MRKLRSDAFGFFLLAVLLLAVPLTVFFAQQQQENRQQAAGTDLAFPDTTENIHLAEYFNYNVSNPISEAGVVDVVMASEYATQPQGMINTYYQHFEIDQNNTKLSISWYKQNHPDWIEYKCDRKTIPQDHGHPVVAWDIDNPAVIDFIWQTYSLPALQKGYAGIYIDNNEVRNIFGRCGHFDKNGNWVQQYTGNLHDPAYAQTALRFIKSLADRIHGFSPNRILSSNFSIAYDAIQDSYKMYDLLDFDLDERGFSNYGDNNHFITDSHWTDTVKGIQYLQGLGKAYFSVNKATVSNHANISKQEIQWDLANYLLVKDAHTYVEIIGQQEYGSIPYPFSEYKAAIGHPLNSMYQLQGVWMRDFSNGKAIVNPSSTQSFTVNLPSNTYQDLYGNTKTSVTLGVYSGIVLLGSNPNITPPPTPSTTGSTALGFNFGHDSTNYDLSPNGVVAQQLAYLTTSGITMIRTAYMGWNNQQSEALALFAKSKGYYVIIGGDWGTLSPTDVQTYDADVLSEAKWAQANHIDQLSIGNEQEYRLSGMSAAQFQSSLKSLAAQVRAVYSGKISYETQPYQIASWQSVGLGDIDMLGLNLYCGEPCNENFITQAINAFGITHVYISETNADMSTGQYTNDATHAQEVTNDALVLHRTFRTMPIYYFAFGANGNDGVPSYWGIYNGTILQQPLTAKVLSLCITHCSTPTPTPPLETTSTPSTTGTPSSGDTLLSLSLILPGIGVNGGNLHPLHPVRNITLLLYNLDTRQLITKHDTVVFDGTFFSNPSLDVGTIPSGNYQLFVKIPQFLITRLSQSQSSSAFPIQSGQTVTIPPNTLIAGDIAPPKPGGSYGDNILDIKDYNILLSCYGAKAQSPSCPDKQAADFDDDGVIDSIDYNLFLRGIAQTTHGDSIPGQTIQ